MSAPTLAELQASVQASVMAGDAGAVAFLAKPHSNTREERLQTYQYAYRMRLVGVLENDYDLLHILLGDDQFAEIAHAYVTVHPSDVANARWYGRHLATFLRAEAPWRDTQLLGDFAALQWALGEAFDADDAPAATMADLAAVEPERAGELVFRLHPAVRHLRFRSNACAMHTAIQAGDAPPALQTGQEDIHVLVWRKGLTAHYREIDDEESMLLDVAREGVNFAVMCEMAATMRDPDSAAMRVAGVISVWLQNGVVSALDLP